MSGISTISGDSAISRGVLFTVRMDLDGIDNRQKKRGRGQQTDPHDEGTAAADTMTGSMASSMTDQTDQATWDPFKRYVYQDITRGYGFALACMLVAFLVRWSFDVYLDDALPYVTFILACIIIAVYCGVQASLIAVALGGLLSNLFFVTPRYELRLTGLLDQAEMAIYLTICLSAIGFIQTWRWAWRKTDIMTKDLRHQINIKGSTKE